MVPLSDLTPRELAVAAMLGRRWTVARIAQELTADEGEVETMIHGLTTKLMADPGLWWRTSFPISVRDRECAR